MGPKEDAQGTSCHRPIPHPSPVILGWQAQAQASQCWGGRRLPLESDRQAPWAALEAGSLVHSARPETEGSGPHLREEVAQGVPWWP